MRQTRGALKFLLAEYRAVLKNAMLAMALATVASSSAMADIWITAFDKDGIERHSDGQDFLYVDDAIVVNSKDDSIGNKNTICGFESWIEGVETGEVNFFVLGSDITAESAQKVIYAHNHDNLANYNSVTFGNWATNSLTITQNQSSDKDAVGVGASGKGTSVWLQAKSIDITSRSSTEEKGSSSATVYAENNSATDGANATVTLYGTDITVTNNSTSGVGHGLWATNNGVINAIGALTLANNNSNAVDDSPSLGILAQDGGVISVKGDLDLKAANSGINALGKNSKVSVNGDKISIETNGLYAVRSQSNVESSDEKNATIELKANSIEIVNNSKEQGATGLGAFSGSNLTVEGDLTLTAKNAIDTRGNSTVNVNTDGKHTTIINGDVVFETPATETDSHNSGKLINSYVNLNLTGEKSSWTGSAYQQYTGDDGKLNNDVELDSNPYCGNVTDFKLTIADGAKWDMTGDSFVNEATVSNGGTITVSDKVETFNAGSLTLTGGKLDAQGGTTTVNTFNASGESTVGLNNANFTMTAGTANLSEITASGTAAFTSEASNAVTVGKVSVAKSGNFTLTGGANITGNVSAEGADVIFNKNANENKYTVGGAVSATNLTANAATTVDGALTVENLIATAETCLNGGAKISSNVEAKDTNVIFGKEGDKNQYTVDGAVTAKDLTANGVTTIGGKLTADNLTATAETTLNGGADISGKLAAKSADVIFGSGAYKATEGITAKNLTANGETTITGTVNADTLTANGATTVENALTVSTLIAKATTTLNGDAEISGSVNAAGANVIFGNANGKYNVEGAVTAKDLTANGVTTIGGKLTADNLTATAETTLNGGAEISGKLAAENADVIFGSGAYKATEGITAKNLTANGETTITGTVNADTLTANGATTIEDALIVSTLTAKATTTLNGGAKISGNVDATGADVILGKDGDHNTYSVGKDVTAKTLTTNGATNITGSVTADAVTANATTTVNGAVTADTLTANAETTIGGLLKATSVSATAKTALNGGAEISKNVDATGADVILGKDGKYNVGGTLTAKDLTVNGTTTIGGAVKATNLTATADTTLNGGATISDSLNAYGANVILGGDVSNLYTIGKSINTKDNGKVVLKSGKIEDDKIGTKLNGSLELAENGLLSTKSDQIYTNVASETEKDSGAVKATNIIYTGGVLNITDDSYTLGYADTARKALTDAMAEGGNTSLIMSGTLVSDSGEVQETTSVENASKLGEDTVLDKVVATAENNLLIGSTDISAKNATVDGVQVQEQVENGFSVAALNLKKDGDKTMGVVITNAKTVTLGGSAGGSIINVVDDNGADTGTPVKVVIGTEGSVAGTTSTEGTLTIGNALATADTQYKLNGEAVINKDSTLKVNGTTEITKSLTLNAGTVDVKEGASLTTAALNVDDSSALTGNAKVSDTVTIADDKVLSVGSNEKAGLLTVKKLTGGTVFLDPAWNNGSEASGLAIEDVSEDISSTLIAGQNSKITLGSKSTSDFDTVFAKTGKIWGENGITAGVNVASNVTLGSGSITADGSLTSAPTTSTAEGSVNFAANSILMVNGEKVQETAAISGVKSTNVDGSSKLYIDNAARNQTYKILAGEAISSVWENGNIISQNRLLKFEGKTAEDNTSFDVTSGVNKIADVYGNAVIAPNAYDQALAGDNALANFALDVAEVGSTETQVSALNSLAALSELAGVAHGTLTAHNLLTDTVADHVSMANALTHDNDVWAKYIHTKEDVDGLGLANFSANYKTQYNGVVIGADVYHNETVTAGVALTYMDGSTSGHTLSAYTDNDSKYYGATLYGNLQFGDTAILGDLTYLYGDNDLTQNNTSKTITGDVDTNALSLGVSVEQAFKTGFGKFVPYAGLRYLHLTADDYTDSLGLSHDGDDMDLLQIPVGLKYSLDTTQCDWTFRTIAKLGYVWNAGDRNTSETVSYGGAKDSFSYDVADSGSYQGHLAIEAQRGNATFGIGYQYQKGDSAKSNAWSASVNYRF